MKKLMAIVAVVFLLLTAVAANAGTYEVKKGDELAKIAREHGLTLQELYEANKAGIKNPDKIYPGQKLQVPAAQSAKAVSRNIKRDGNWDKVNVDPWGERPLADALKNMPASEMPEVARKKFESLISTKGESFLLKKGTKLNVLFSGHTIHVGITARLNAHRDVSGIESRIWIIEEESMRYVFGQALYMITEGGTAAKYSCFNPFLITEKIPPPAEVKKAEVAEIKKEEKAEEVTPPPPVIEKKPHYGRMAIPPIKKAEVAEIKKEEKAEEVTPPPVPIKLPTFIWKPSFDASTFAGASRRIQGEGEGSYWGIDASLYLFKYKLGKGVLEAGPSFQYVGWMGWDYDIPMAADGHWEGYKQVYGIGSRYTTNNTETTLKVRYGEKRGWFDLLRYGNEEKNGLLNAELYHTVWFKRSWFHDLEVGFRTDIDLGGEKKSWNGSYKIPSKDDPRSNQSEYALSLKTELYKGKYLTPTIGVSGVYARYNDFNGNNYILTPQVGVKFFDDKASINAEYQVREGSGNNAVGVGLVIEIDKVLDGLIKWFQQNQTTK